MFDHLMIGLRRKPTKPGPYLHEVRLVTPELGFGTTLNEMIEFCRDRGQDLTKARQPKGPDRWKYTTFLFADSADADAFQARFGGELTGTNPDRTA